MKKRKESGEGQRCCWRKRKRRSSAESDKKRGSEVHCDEKVGWKLTERRSKDSKDSSGKKLARITIEQRRLKRGGLDERGGEKNRPGGKSKEKAINGSWKNKKFL